MSEPTADILRRAANDGLACDEESPWYGRFRLRADQVTPNYRPSFDVCLRLHPGTEEEVGGLLDELDWPVAGLFETVGEADLRARSTSVVYPFEDTDHLLVFSMEWGGVIYMTEENLVAGFQLFAGYVEDGHFFVYSTGDDDDRWVHEYRIVDGTMSFERHLVQDEIFTGIIDFYLARNVRTPEWLAFLDDVVGDRARVVYPHVAQRWLERVSELREGI